MKATKETYFVVRISTEIKDKAKKLAKKQGTNLSTLIRMILIKELEKNKI